MTCTRLFRSLGLALVIGGLAASLGAQEVLFSTNDRFTGDEGAEPHRYTLGVQAGQRIEVIVRSDEVDTFLEARLPDGRTVVNDDYDGLNAGFTRVVTRDGVLVLETSPLFEERPGRYEIVVRSLGVPGMVSVGDRIEAELGKDALEGARAQDRYLLEGTAGQTVVITLTSDDFDAYLELEADDGRRFADDDGAGTGLDSLLSYRFDRDGSVEIFARSFSGSDTGTYVLSVEAFGEELLAAWEGSLDASDRRSYDGRLIDTHEFEGPAGDRVSIVLRSDSFDPMLYVSAPDGTSLASDDDSGGNRDSLVTFTLPEEGVYRLHVLSVLGGGGDYELTVVR
mgnify:CR=1 FL=1